MKPAVSLPDRVYREAEGYAKRTRKCRSQLSAEGLAEYLARHAPDEVTEAMNLVADEPGAAAKDAFVRRGWAADAQERGVVDVAQGDVWWADLPEPEVD